MMKFSRLSGVLFKGRLGKNPLGRSYETLSGLFSSDDREYCRLMAENVEGSALFRPDQEAGTPWQGIVTDFERKWLEAGRTVEHRFWHLPQGTVWQSQR